MREAENYNRYLLDLDRALCRRRDARDRLRRRQRHVCRPVRAAGFDVTAVEPDEGLRVALSAAGVRTVADAATLPDEAFEYAYTLNVLEHIHADVEALRTLHAKLGARWAPIRLCACISRALHQHGCQGPPRSPLHAHDVERQACTLRASRSKPSATQIHWASPQPSRFKAIDNGRGDVNRRMLRLYDRLAFPVSRALDSLTHRWVGKNLLAVARKPLR